MRLLKTQTRLSPAGRRWYRSASGGWVSESGRWTASTVNRKMVWLKLGLARFCMIQGKYDTAVNFKNFRDAFIFVDALEDGKVREDLIYIKLEESNGN